MYTTCVDDETFTNGLHSTKYSSQFIPDPSSAFTVGQVVQCRVLECDPANKKLSWTFKVL